MKFKLPHSTQNWISLIGATIAVISLFMIIFLFVITGLLAQQGSYIGLVIYILLPAVMITGLILIPVGMFLTTRKERMQKSKEEWEDWPKIDLNNIRHRNAFFVFSIGTTIFLFLSAVGSYEAFHFTESTEFCGQLCHSVMQPEFVAYQHSSHARIRCVDCHVGSGADWYIRSKLSGMYQVYAVLANVYPKPISTPISNLRPARETCEQCHWPEKFYTQNLRSERHYLNDEKNTPWDIHLRMKIGASHAALGLTEGIHWHINSNVRIEYVTGDARHETIPWVRYTNLNTGKATVYRDEENALEDSVITDENIRVMDCIDCHNRPSHSYKPPAFFVNEALTAGEISPELPGIKSLAMEICAEEISDSDSARNFIRKSIREYYESDYPEIFNEKPELVEQAIVGLQTVYFENIFPEMNVRWSAYPNHIGHLEFNGCFRCHNDTHADEEGNVIGKDCNICHTIEAQGDPDNLQSALTGESLTFVHPVDIDDAWQEGLCTDCHTGLNP